MEAMNSSFKALRHEINGGMLTAFCQYDQDRSDASCGPSVRHHPDLAHRSRPDDRGGAAGPMTAAALGDKLEVTVRTIYRDIVALQASRVPI
jgi:hypothetical protein